MTPNGPGSDHGPFPISIALRAPVILMVLAATAIPIELRPLGDGAFSFGLQTSDVLANVAGYVPVGMVLAGLGSTRAITSAAMIAIFAETGQLVMAHRDPSVVDIAANVIGAIIGTRVSARWKLQALEINLSRSRAIAAGLLVFAIVGGVWAAAGEPLNARGVTSPGALEAHWRLDERGGRVARDASPRALDGRFNRDAVPVGAVAGSAVTFDGRNDYIVVGHRTPLRLSGSMTISAWINSSSFPVDDAAIVSSLSGGAATPVGFQLDTTIDRGARTIGFKVGNACGQLMARYGATPLVAGTWYYVTGVYDAETRTLDVYLNGQLDNGFLLGPVTGASRSSRTAVYVGRRASAGFEFAGSVGDVRIYSRPLPQTEIAADMRGAVDDESTPPATEAPSNNITSAGKGAPGTPACAIMSDREDAQVIPVAAAGIGLLATVACLGFWSSAGWLWALTVSLAAGLLLLPATSPTLPALNLWLIPLTSLAGGASALTGLSSHSSSQTDSPSFGSL